MQGAKLDSCGLRPSRFKKIYFKNNKYWSNIFNKRYVITKEENDRLVLHVNSED